MSEHPARGWSHWEIDDRIERLARARALDQFEALRIYTAAAWCSVGFTAGAVAGFLVARFL